LSAFFSISAHGYALSHPFWLDRSYERMTGKPEIELKSRALSGSTIRPESVNE
jgi:hypothetical protein